MALHTRLCDRLGIQYPIINAPMGGGDAPGELAAAVSEAGGLGMIGGTTKDGGPWLVDQIRRARALTDRPFGVGVISHFPGAAELMGIALDEGARVIAHSFSDPAPFVGAAHDAGALVLCQVRSVAGRGPRQPPASTSSLRRARRRAATPAGSRRCHWCRRWSTRSRRSRWSPRAGSRTAGASRPR